MTPFRDLPIRRKLFLAILGTTSIALLAACAAFIAFELVTFRGTLESKTKVIADILGTNSTATLEFKNSGDAETILGALKADPEIIGACIYTPDGKQFATYTQGEETSEFPEVPGADGARFIGDRLMLYRAILAEDGKRAGTIHLEASLDGLNDRLRSYAGISGLVILASMLIAILLTTGLQRLISRPILNLAKTAELISRKKDYSARAEKLSNDELGLLTDSFNQMLTDIGERNSALVTANESLQSQSRQIAESVVVLNSSAREILDFTAHVSSSAAQTATAVTETTTTVEEVRQIAHHSSDKALQVSHSAETVTQSSQVGKSATEETLVGMNLIRQQMESIAQSMVRLSEQSQAIAQIVAAVDDLAAQSSLLAVNASIEAAKAGEQGRGFAVVAQEVKSLAHQSKQATNQVRTILTDIQKATSDAVMASEQGSKAVDAGVKKSTDAGKSIVALAESVTLAAEAARQIAASAKQQLVGMDQVASAMESVKQVSTHNLDSAHNLQIAARKLSELGERLQQLVVQSGDVSVSKN